MSSVIGAKIRQYRRLRGITQEQLDRISGIEEVRLVGKFRSVEKK